MSSLNCLMQLHSSLAEFNSQRGINWDRSGMCSPLVYMTCLNNGLVLPLPSSIQTCLYSHPSLDFYKIRFSVGWTTSLIQNLHAPKRHPSSHFGARSLCFQEGSSFSNSDFWRGNTFNFLNSIPTTYQNALSDRKYWLDWKEKLIFFFFFHYFSTAQSASADTYHK